MMLGILGGGQLGRMLALAGHRLGIRSRVFDSAPTACAGQVTELVCGDFGDEAALRRFSAGLTAVTFEFESVPPAAAAMLGERLPVRPPLSALSAAAERLLEKQLFRQLGIPTTDFFAVDSAEGLRQAVAALGMPAVLKTRRFGYDGKGQAVLRRPADVDAAWAALGAHPLILEAYVEFEQELSLLACRWADGAMRFYPLVHNEHRDGVLCVSRCPARLPRVDALQALAEDYARRVLDHFGYVGVLAIEFFRVGDALLANEMAPRVHNSGHWTIEGAATSQFENHLRAVLDLPPGEVGLRGQCALANLLGAPPPLAALAAVRGAAIHLYGKPPAPGRKVGHVTLCGAAQEVDAGLEAVQRLLA